MFVKMYLRDESSSPQKGKNGPRISKGFRQGNDVKSLCEQDSQWTKRFCEEENGVYGNERRYILCLVAVMET